MGMFQRGYDASRAEKERQDKVRENMGKKLFRFFIKEDGEEADLRFLNEEPVNFKEHSIRVGERFENYTCTGDDCPFCADGDRPTYKGAYIVIDRRPFEYTDKNGKKQKGKNQPRLFVMGMKVVSQLDRIHERYGLSKRDVTIIRLGKGTQTTYTIERGEEEKMTTKEIKELLPEKLRDDYDGTQESVMDMIEAQLLMNTKDYDPAADEEDDEDEGETTSARSKLISVDKDDEGEEEAPARPAKKGGLKSKFRRAEDSVKPKAKTFLRQKSEDVPF